MQILVPYMMTVIVGGHYRLGGKTNPRLNTIGLLDYRQSREAIGSVVSIQSIVLDTCPIDSVSIRTGSPCSPAIFHANFVSIYGPDSIARQLSCNNNWCNGRVGETIMRGKSECR